MREYEPSSLERFGKVEVINPPRTDDFGTYTRRRSFTEKGIGKINIADALLSEVNHNATVLAHANTPDLDRVIGIGNTPAKYDPRKSGGVQLEDAGKPGEYLMVIYSRHKQTNEETTLYRYLDVDDFAGSEAGVENGGMLVFAVNNKRARHITVDGVVDRFSFLYAH